MIFNASCDYIFQLANKIIEDMPYMEKVDLSKARIGQIVHFRCGGRAKIKKVYSNRSFLFEGNTYSWSFGDNNYGIFDIICLEDPSFDWSDLKQGMCFIDNEDHERGYFCFYNDAGIPCFSFNNFAAPQAIMNHRDRLKRCPEHDISVKP